MLLLLYFLEPPELEPIGCYVSTKLSWHLSLRESKDYLQLKWDPFPKSIYEVLFICGALARASGYNIVAVEFWAECRGVVEGAVDYASGGISSDCEYGVGKINTMMVHKILD